MPFMAFTKNDCWKNGDTVNVYDGKNYQIYASGNVYITDVFISQENAPVGDIPVLSTAILNDNSNNNIFSITNAEINGYIDGDGNYHYQLFTDENPLTYATGFNTGDNVNWEVSAINGFGGTGSGNLAYLGDSWTYLVEGGPDKFWVKELGNSQYVVDYTRNPNWQPSSGPALTSFKIGASQEGDMVNMSGISVSGNQDGNYIRYDLENVNFGTAITENNGYLINLGLDNGNNMGTRANASWVNDGVGLGWAFHSNNTPIYEVFITVASQSDTVASKIEVKYNPNWQPSSNNLNLLRINDNSTGNVIYENTSLDIAKNNNMWVLNGAQFTSSVGENTPLNIYIETSNGTQAGYSNTATLVSGTPSYYSITPSQQGPISETRLIPNGTNIYDIQLLGN